MVVRSGLPASAAPVLGFALIFFAVSGRINQL